MSSKDLFLFPLIYTGPQEAKDAAEILNLPEPLVFKLGPLSRQPGPLEGQKYADVTEKQGRLLVKRFPTIWAWPEGTEFGPQMVTVEQYEAMLRRLEVLEEAVSTLTPKKPGRPAPVLVKEPADALA